MSLPDGHSSPAVVEDEFVFLSESCREVEVTLELLLVTVLQSFPVRQVVGD